MARLHCPQNFLATAIHGGRRLVLSEALRPARIAPFATSQNLKLSAVFQNMETERFRELETELKVTGLSPMHCIGRLSRRNSDAEPTRTLSRSLRIGAFCLVAARFC
jgi:hypothetical protein